jgi:hypothetical protein
MQNEDEAEGKMIKEVRWGGRGTLESQYLLHFLITAACLRGRVL